MEAKRRLLLTLSLQDMLLFCWPLLLCQTLSIIPKKFKMLLLSVTIVYTRLKFLGLEFERSLQGINPERFEP